LDFGRLHWIAFARPFAATIGGTVRVLFANIALEDAFEFYACAPLEAMPFV
jgi:hypothetical protein